MITGIDGVVASSADRQLSSLTPASPDCPACKSCWQGRELRDRRFGLRGHEASRNRCPRCSRLRQFSEPAGSELAAGSRALLADTLGPPPPRRFARPPRAVIPAEKTRPKSAMPSSRTRSIGRTRANSTRDCPRRDVEASSVVSRPKSESDMSGGHASGRGQRGQLASAKVPRNVFVSFCSGRYVSTGGGP